MLIPYPYELFYCLRVCIIFPSIITDLDLQNHAKLCTFGLTRLAAPDDLTLMHPSLDTAKPSLHKPCCLSG
jgi:hypothetical protein